MASPSSAGDLSEVEARVVELEVRYTHQERALGELSEVVYRQQQLVDQLERRLKQLEKRLVEVGEPAAPRDPKDEVPPHY